MKALRTLWSLKWPEKERGKIHQRKTVATFYTFSLYDHYSMQMDSDLNRYLNRALEYNFYIVTGNCRMCVPNYQAC